MSDSLMHYGVLGMRWGVRRTPEQLGRRRGTVDAYKLAEQKRTEQEKRMASKTRGTLSDDELQARIRRLQQEKLLRELTEAEVSPGRKFVKDVMYDAGKQAATQVAKNSMLFAGKQFVGKALGQKDLADALFNIKTESKKNDDDSSESKKDKKNKKNNDSSESKKNEKNSNDSSDSKKNKNNNSSKKNEWKEEYDPRWEQAARSYEEEQKKKRRRRWLG